MVNRVNMNPVFDPVSEEDWDARRMLIQRLYLEKCLTLNEVRQRMIRDHGFRAT